MQEKKSKGYKWDDYTCEDVQEYMDMNMMMEGTDECRDSKEDWADKCCPRPDLSCLMQDELWKGDSESYKSDSAADCFKKCGKYDCKAWSYKEGSRKSCLLFDKARKSKGKDGVLSGKDNCSPTMGKMKREK